MGEVEEEKGRRGGRGGEGMGREGGSASGQAETNHGAAWPREPSCQRSQGIGNHTEQGILGQGPREASGSGVQRKEEMEDGSWSSPRGDREGHVSPRRGQGERVGPSGLDSLLCDDVIPRQGRAGHPCHLHVVGDLGEVQA